MKTRYLAFFYLLLVFLLPLSAQAAQPDWPDPFAMDFPAVEVTPVESTKVTLSNGMVVFLLEDRSLPLINGIAYIRAGSNYDPEDQRGLAQLTAMLTREGGAGQRSAEDVNRTLEFLAASVEMTAAGPFTSASFSSLSHNVDEVLAVLADMVQEPQFAEDRLEILRGRILESIRRQIDQPVSLASREFFYRAVGEHPSEAYPTLASVQNLARDDVLAFHQRYFRPNQTVMAVSGDFDSAAMVELLEETFAAWQPAETEPPELPPLNMKPEPVIYHVQRDLAQSVVLLGHPVLTFDDPDYIRLDVLNRILGGAGDNRLFTEIRTRRGYAYSVGSQVTQGFEFPGIFFAFSISRADKTGEVIELLLQEIAGVIEAEVSTEELERNRRAIVNRAVFRYASVQAVAQRSAVVHFLGVDPNYYDEHMAIIQDLTVSELLAAGQRHLRPDEAVILVVGNSELFDRDLEEFGTVISTDLD